jgi:hypothetical protein
MAAAQAAASAAVRAVLAAARVTVEGEEAMLAAAAGAPPVYAFWHGKQMPLLAYRTRFPLGIMVSRSLDGELLGRILRDCGHRVARGSSSRGGDEGYAGLVALFREGCAPTFAADGPRGPYHVLKPGAVRMAAELQRPLVTASAAASPARAVGSWDRLELVAPFARVAVVFGESFRFPPGIEGDELRGATGRVAAAIDACTARAEEMIRRRA